MLPPEPRLQVSAPKDLEQYEAAQEEILNNYGWVDQKAGIVRIPIDRAMDILVQIDRVQHRPVVERRGNGFDGDR